MGVDLQGRQAVVAPVQIFSDKTKVSSHTSKWTTVVWPSFIPASGQNTSGYTSRMKVAIFADSQHTVICHV